ncbi:hypothetical protein JL722_1816 [Aureococcus anophagefferens]|nr:hypothetical protein JL722_1816 [Aureococcus anophagefferens]
MCQLTLLRFDERLVVPCKDTVELKLSVANVFSAAASALGRGEAVEIREDGKLERRCTPGDASALADEFRSRGRAGAAEAWANQHGDRVLCAVVVEGAGATAPRVGVASCSLAARALTLFAFDDDVSLGTLEACLAQVGCDEALVADAASGALADAARRCGAALTVVGPPAFAQPLRDVARTLKQRCGGDDDDESCAVVDEAAARHRGLALKASSALLERISTTAAFDDDFRASTGDVGTAVQLDAATIRALDLVAPRDAPARPSVLGLLRGHAACRDVDRVAAALGREACGLAGVVRAYDAAAALGRCADALDAEALAGFQAPLARAVAGLGKLRLLVEEVVDVAALPKVAVRASLCDGLEALEQARSAASNALDDVVAGVEVAILGAPKKRKRKADAFHVEDGDGALLLRATKANAAKVRGFAGATVVQTRRGGEVLFTTDALTAAALAKRRADAARDDARAQIVAQCVEVARTFQTPLRRACRAAADVDALCALAGAAAELGWARPTLVDGGGLTLDRLRHPLVEAATSSYVPSDLALGGHAKRCALVTGPNMGGKSTYARAAAVAVVLAHCGSYVPADAAVVPRASRVLARVGAADDPRAGESTFLREMRETASILRRATRDALVVVDEIGRGTSTEDGAARRPEADFRESRGGKDNEKSSCSVGTALAHAVLLTLADAATGPLCLFTTHFFELTRMEGDEHASLANFHVDALARDGALTLLYEVKPGASQGQQKGASAASFGVECAALAGFPAAVVADAARRAKAAEAAAVA